MSETKYFLRQRQLNNIEDVLNGIISNLESFREQFRILKTTQEAKLAMTEILSPCHRVKAIAQLDLLGRVISYMCPQCGTCFYPIKRPSIPTFKEAK